MSLEITKDIEQRIAVGLDEIRPFLKSDGGDIRFVKFDNDGTVTVEFQGACTGCSVNQMTLKSGVEMTIKKHAPEVLRVVEVGLMKTQA